jgi:phosphoribosylaminoimidazole-succinocarboxamide synthase
VIFVKLKSLIKNVLSQSEKPTLRKGANMNEREKREAISVCVSLDNCIKDTDFLCLPNRKTGKVRDSYDLSDYGLGDRLLLITTDRQSAFDRILASVPFKGQVLNLTSAYWFEATKDIVPNHVISIPDPNAVLAKKCRVFPVEFVVRGYLTGSTDTSAWTLYNKGQRNICGNILSEGMTKNQKFDSPILTPTTKSDQHDESISLDEIVERGLIDRPTLDRLAKIVFALFDRGTRIAAAHGLILVDTKYELGMDSSGVITLLDEIHTPDSSRYWSRHSYRDLIAAGAEPESIDKEFLRLWFRDHCDPYHDEVLPEAPRELVEELSFRYVRLFETITGKEFDFFAGSIEERLGTNISHILQC